MTSLFNLAISALLLVSNPADTKHPQKSIKGQTVSTANGNYISGWESDHVWQQTTTETNKVYYTKRQLPQLTEDMISKGAVLVFAKGYNLGAANLPEKPMVMPFYFFSSDETISSPFNWIVEPSQGEMEVGLKMPVTLDTLFQKSQANIQLRYFLIEEAFLKKHKLTTKALHNMKYQQLVQLMETTP